MVGERGEGTKKGGNRGVGGWGGGELGNKPLNVSGEEGHPRRFHQKIKGFSKVEEKNFTYQREKG